MRDSQLHVGCVLAGYGLVTPMKEMATLNPEEQRRLNDAKPCGVEQMTAKQAALELNVGSFP
jgi:hypothetical protein